jgi:hypothetical protein
MGLSYFLAQPPGPSNPYTFVKSGENALTPYWYSLFEMVEVGNFHGCHGVAGLNCIDVQPLVCFLRIEAI